ncbi:hypothetical protein [Pseudozobellia sp. WGM2]|uniref:hypothetical protein n=1 Tax=Pseudozobellia sp. WGM2 TaxID=2787625 RepID=UPI001ADF02D4|nr:hypothetical protein [Pseudozobellia sp. WGM2]
MRHLFMNTKGLLTASAAALVLFSCSDDAEEALDYENESKVSKTELKTILETDDVSSAADLLVTNLYNSGKSGKTAKTDDDCYTATYSDTGFNLVFDNCKIEEDGAILNGAMSIVYGGDEDEYAFSITYDNLMVGEFAIDGTRSFIVHGNDESQSVSWTVESDLAITLEDGSKVDEEGTKTVALVFSEDFEDGSFTVDGEWILKANGNTYIVDITDILEAEFGCEHFGKGMMNLNKNGLEVDVDFGEGECDAVATVIYPDGTEDEVSLKD